LADLQILVVGLGRFGSAFAKEAVALGHEVLGTDTDAKVVQQHADEVTHVVQADATDVDALRQLGAGDFPVAIVAIGSDLEASILTTAALADVGVPTIWAKAVSESHGRILQRVGADHVVYPEGDMGRRVAHRVVGRVLDWFQLDEDFAMVETAIPAELVGRSFGESGVRAKHGVTVVAIKPSGGSFGYATADTVPGAGDIVVVSGPTKAVERFAEQTS
jgi:trk system potassium uptake protein TrkA